MEDDSLGFELDPTLDDNGMLGLQPNSCEADREEAVFILEDFETEAESETTSLDQPMEIDAADDNLAYTDLGRFPTQHCSSDLLLLLAGLWCRNLVCPICCRTPGLQGR